MVQKCPLFCVGFVLSLYKKRAAVGGHDKARVKKTLGKLSKFIFRQMSGMKEKRIKMTSPKVGTKKELITANHTLFTFMTSVL